MSWSCIFGLNLQSLPSNLEFGMELKVLLKIIPARIQTQVLPNDSSLAEAR